MMSPVIVVSTTTWILLLMAFSSLRVRTTISLHQREYHRNSSHLSIGWLRRNQGLVAHWGITNVLGATQTSELFREDIHTSAREIGVSIHPALRGLERWVGSLQIPAMGPQNGRWMGELMAAVEDIHWRLDEGQSALMR
ncbi:hypothetical protein FRX31_001943 [Thalictrum thalictroides]|uniref:Uncharacterized protein n=1 Tax=Thalictrum thalictroides TaxID=46969 RepID=A0A7J6XFY4_THATH|nr:hypothetical protein FRX31_001943 [Thalictrum thalictroides]